VVVVVCRQLHQTFPPNTQAHLFSSPDGQKKAFVRLSADSEALDVANKVSLRIYASLTRSLLPFGLCPSFNHLSLLSSFLVDLPNYPLTLGPDWHYLNDHGLCGIKTSRGAETVPCYLSLTSFARLRSATNAHFDKRKSLDSTPTEQRNTFFFFLFTDQKTRGKTRARCCLGPPRVCRPPCAKKLP
jgi:hypothetical protein